MWPVRYGVLESCLLTAHLQSDGNGSIDRDEFFQIQQIANNPLATRLMAIFDEECVDPMRACRRRYDPRCSHGFYVVEEALLTSKSLLAV